PPTYTMLFDTAIAFTCPSGIHRSLRSACGVARAGRSASASRMSARVRAVRGGLELLPFQRIRAPYMRGPHGGGRALRSVGRGLALSIAHYRGCCYSGVRVSEGRDENGE